MWKKPDREKQTLYDLIYMWNLKMLNLLKQRMEWKLPRTRSGDAARWLANGTQL